MSKFVQKVFYNYFDKKNKDKNNIKESDKLSQPISKENMSPEDISSNKKRFWKRIIIWTVVLGGLGGIIAGIVVSATRKSEIFLDENTALNTTTDDNVITFINGNNSYNVNLNNNFVSSYYASTQNQIYL